MNKRATILTVSFVVGLVCAGYGFYRLYRNWQLVDRSERAAATVMYLDTRLSNPNQRIESWHRASEYSAQVIKTVVYETQSGERIVWQSPFSSEGSASLWGGGYEDREAAVLYDPANPTYFELDSVTAMFVNWFALLIAGLVLLSVPFGPYDAVMSRLRGGNDELEQRVARAREELNVPKLVAGRRDESTSETREDAFAGMR